MPINGLAERQEVLDLPIVHTVEQKANRVLLLLINKKGNEPLALAMLRLFIKEDQAKGPTLDLEQVRQIYLEDAGFPKKDCGQFMTELLSR